MKPFLRFLYGFFVGDDPVVAAGVVLTLGVTALVATTSVPAWWIVPVAVAGLLAASLWRASSPR
jgi:tetrahydrodipicolinate N-succinyltransferase